MAIQKNRDYFFDNYKAFLILLVVLGHFIDLSYKNNLFLYTLKWLIVSFHMPAFIFISGYFSKKKASLKDLIRKLAIPYLVYEVLYYLLYTFVIHKPTELYLLYPKFSLWYIQALFFWKLLTPLVKKLPHYMVISTACGLLAGCLQMPDNFLSIPRTLVFFPFFLAGTVFDRTWLTTIRTRRNRLIAGTGILCFICYLIFDPFHKRFSPKIFYGRYNYEYLDQPFYLGIVCRVFCYMIGFAMTLAAALFISLKQTCYSYIGTRTMAVYLFHGLAYTTIKGSTDLLENVTTLGESIVLVLSCILLTLLFSIQKLTSFTNKVAAVSLPPKAPLLLRQNSPYYQSKVGI